MKEDVLERGPPDRRRLNQSTECFMERQDKIIRRAMHNLDRMADDSRLEAEAVGDGIGQGRSIGGLEPERLISEASAQFGWAAFGDDTAFIDDGDPITLLGLLH